MIAFYWSYTDEFFLEVFGGTSGSFDKIKLGSSIGEVIVSDINYMCGGTSKYLQ